MPPPSDVQVTLTQTVRPGAKHHGVKMKWRAQQQGQNRVKIEGLCSQTDAGRQANFTADTTAGSNQLANVSVQSTQGQTPQLPDSLQLGQCVIGPGIPVNAIIQSISGNVATISVPATATATAQACYSVNCARFTFQHSFDNGRTWAPGASGFWQGGDAGPRGFPFPAMEEPFDGVNSSIPTDTFVELEQFGPMSIGVRQTVYGA